MDLIVITALYDSQFGPIVSAGNLEFLGRLSAERPAHALLPFP